MQFVGPMLQKRIRAVALFKDLVFVATGALVLAFRRGREVAAMGRPDGSQVQLLVRPPASRARPSKPGSPDTIRNAKDENLFCIALLSNSVFLMLNALMVLRPPCTHHTSTPTPAPLNKATHLQ